MAAAPIKPSRARRVCKWAALIVSVAIAAAWIGSRWWFVAWDGRLGALGIARGIGYGWFPDLGARGYQYGWTNRLPGVDRWMWWPNGSLIDRTTYDKYILVQTPLWLPVLSMLTLSMWIWHRDRLAVHEGHCRRCHYDLTGLPPASRCPECGHITPGLGGDKAPAT